MSAAADTVSAKPFVSFLPDPVTERSQQLERLETELTELWGHITAAAYRFLNLLAEFDKINGYEVHGLTGTAQWLSWQCGIGGNAAPERVRVARALERLPKISDAFRCGVIGYSKVRAITRVARPEDEHILLNTAPHVERHVRGFRFCQRRDEAREANDRHRERYLKVYRDENGAVVIHAVLPAEVGALVEKALEAAVAELDEPAAAEVTETESNVSTATPAAHKPDGSAEAGAVAATETAAASTAGDEDLTSRIDAMLDEIERRDLYRVPAVPEVSEPRHEPFARAVRGWRHARGAAARAQPPGRARDRRADEPLRLARGAGSTSARRSKGSSGTASGRRPRRVVSPERSGSAGDEHASARTIEEGVAAFSINWPNRDLLFHGRKQWTASSRCRCS